MRYQFWRRLSAPEQEARITEALKGNIDYTEKVSLGIPASKLDPNVFNDQVSFLKDAPLLRAYVQNPNHIGCHTMGSSETFFRGTQEIEKDVISLLSVDLLGAEIDSCDGYIAAGGTEANMQAIWIYRNYFIRDFGANIDEIAILSSVDTHYSIAKAANLLNIKWLSVPVNDDRTIDEGELDRIIINAKKAGIKYFIIVSNMGTTMFGSVDDPSVYANCLIRHEVQFKLHVDGAFGGFVYPVSRAGNSINFSNKHVSSITLDAHKMLQAPYGTGIFIVRKGLMEYVYTKEADYVNGMDITLSGSRSGTNAIAIWMILMTYGPHGWFEKINKLLYRTDWLCKQLDGLGIEYYRNPSMNIVTIKAQYVQPEVVHKFGLVPDSHQGQANWYKIVVMDHVQVEHLHEFIEEVSLKND
ncbi:MAG: aspartate aminotransferase family protein [Bacteroidetes bacterium]|nr:aspartate aminotransferase family protein [Bacteroidota bacterium]